MEHIENTNQENAKEPLDLNKLTPHMRAYFEARDAFFKEWGAPSTL